MKKKFGIWAGSIHFDVSDYGAEPGYFKARVKARPWGEPFVEMDATARCPNRALGFALAALGAELAAQKADPIDHPSTRGNA